MTPNIITICIAIGIATLLINMIVIFMKSINYITHVIANKDAHINCIVEIISIFILTIIISLYFIYN